MDEYERQSLDPMLIGKESAAFDDPEWIYELKFDGCRCLLYADPPEIELINKRHIRLTSRFPEFDQIGRQITRKCILDGELYVYRNGRPDFFELQRRLMTADPFRIALLAQKNPATITVFDALYAEQRALINRPLIERKEVLRGLIKDSDRLNVSRTFEGQGKALFELVAERGLEGIVAKKKTSLYYPGKRTAEWIKCKNQSDDDFVIAGYIKKRGGMTSLVLGQYKGHELIYRGHVTLGVSLSSILRYTRERKRCPFSSLPSGSEEAVWLTPFLVGTVRYMELTAKGGLRQPVFKGLREDKAAKDCQYTLPE